MKNKKYILIGITIVLFLLALVAIFIAMFTPGSGSSKEIGEIDGTYCTIEQRNSEACITLYDPVCAIRKDGMNFSYGNSCLACADEQTVYWKEGFC